MTASSDIMLWAQRILERKQGKPHLLLDIRETATVEEAQAAFHKIAKRAHPDLFRASLSPEDLEKVTSAYSVVAGAYQSFRATVTSTGPMSAIRRDPTPSSVPLSGPPSAMSSRALVYYRKAELSLRRGDLSGAALQLKMAIATDPQSAFLRTALAEVESELTRGD